MGKPEEQTDTKSVGRKIIDTVKLVTVEPYIFFCLFGYTVRLVSFQDLLMDRACRGTYGYPDDVCDNLAKHAEAQEKSIELGNNLYTGVMLLTSLPAVVVVIFLGPWSDKYSRKWPLIFAVTGMLAESLATFFLTINSHIPPIYFMFVALFSGVTGGFLVGMSSAASYLSDVTDARSRASRFAVMDFFSIAAVVFGNVVGGQVYKAYGYQAVISLSPIFHASALLYSIFILKDSKPPIDKGKLKDIFKDIFTLDNIKQSYRTCSRPRYGNIRLQIWLLVWIDFTFKFIHMGTVAIAFAYAKKMYNMGVTEYSNTNTVLSTIGAFVTVGGVPLLSKKLLLHEAAIGLIGVFSLMAKMVLMTVAFSVPYFYFAMVSGTLANCIGIAVRSRLSKLVAKEELGRAFSLLGTFGSIAPMMGTAIFFQIYNLSLNIFTGLTYAAAAIFLLPCSIIFLWMTKMPTVSVGDYGKEEDTALENVTSKYKTLKEEEEAGL